MSRLIRDVRPNDRAGWERLFTAYALSGGRSLEQSQLDTVWGWIQDPQHEAQALLAVDNEQGAVGLAHYRPFARAIRLFALQRDDPVVRGSWPCAGMGVAETSAQKRTTSRERGYGLAA